MTSKHRILFVCIHNSARSQMAEAFLKKHGGDTFEAESAGLEPGALNPNVVEVMQEIGIDLTGKTTRSVSDLLRQGRHYDAVITVCDKEAAERCPVFPGAGKRIAWSFRDPSAFTGSREEILDQTRAVRDEIERQIETFVREAGRVMQPESSTSAAGGKLTQTEEIKNMVREKYSAIALQDKATNESSCCGSGCCSTEVYNIMSDDYSTLDGYNPDADLGLGCGLPTQFAQIKTGDTVIDLGSGAGNDCFIARKETGDTGKVIGIDFTPAMIGKARANAEKLGYKNVEFRQGDIEKMPVTSDTADVIVSNCVLNLVPDKTGVFAEIYRVLKPGGHFSISDIVLAGELPGKIGQAAEMYAGCVAGAIQKQEYLRLIETTGFTGITLQKEKPIVVPDDILGQYLTAGEIAQFKSSGTGIYSITVFAEKPGHSGTCCGPDCCS